MDVQTAHLPACKSEDRRTELLVFIPVEMTLGTRVSGFITDTLLEVTGEVNGSKIRSSPNETLQLGRGSFCFSGVPTMG